MFAYERDVDSSLVIAAGIPENWLRENQGIGISGLSTHYGPLSYTMRAIGSVLNVKIGSGVRVPSGGIVVQPPMTTKPTQILLNGKSLPITSSIRIDAVPATLIIRY
jgi:hypothetical protein